jgi:hypothetical protein
MNVCINNDNNNMMYLSKYYYTGTKLPDSYETFTNIDGYTNKKNSNIISNGHYGCLLSHIKCIELAKKRNYEGIIIMEDDIILMDNFKNIIDNIKYCNMHIPSGKYGMIAKRLCKYCDIEEESVKTLVIPHKVSKTKSGVNIGGTTTGKITVSSHPT